MSETVNNYYNYVNIQTVNLQLPDGSVVQLSNLNDNTVADPFGGTQTAYYFDRANGHVIVFVTPEPAVDYLCKIYFKDSTKLNMQPINFTVTETKNYYYTDTSGGGGCDLGIDVGFAAVLLAASGLVGLVGKKRDG